MRRNNLNHGTGSVASPRLRTGSVASSFAVSGGAVGVSRKYHNQTRTQPRLKNARTTNAPRHDTSPTSAAIRGRVSDPRRRMRDALGETPTALRHPCRHRAGRGRKGRAFADPESKPCCEQACKSADDAGCRRRRAYDETADEQRPTCTEFVAEVAPDQLEQRIRIGECRKSQAELRVAEVKLRLDQWRGGGNVDPIHVEDQVHEADDQQDRVGNAQSAHQAGAALPLICVRCMMRRVEASNGSRRCMVQRLSHSTRSPTCQTCSQANSGRATKSQSSSSKASESASSSPTRYALRRRPR